MPRPTREEWYFACLKGTLVSYLPPLGISRVTLEQFDGLVRRVQVSCGVSEEDIKEAIASWIGELPYPDPEMDAVASKSEILNSWKEVAQYLGRGTRTVQRWEKDLGLPVRRFRGKRRGAVMALRQDLDQWIRNRPQFNLQENGDGADPLPMPPGHVPIHQRGLRSGSDPDILWLNNSESTVTSRDVVGARLVGLQRSAYHQDESRR